MARLEGQVGFGATKEAGLFGTRWRPEIKMTVNGKVFSFKCDKTFKEVKDVQTFAELCFEILCNTEPRDVVRAKDGVPMSEKEFNEKVHETMKKRTKEPRLYNFDEKDNTRF